LITGQLRQDRGKISVGQTIVFGYFSQESIVLEKDKRVIDAVKDIAENVILGKAVLSASAFLNHFGFSHSVQYNYVSSLSGGERRRLQLLMVLIKNPNFLILDEPTNDLDIQTLNALEEFLDEFKGCLLMVSHDRYFLDNLTDHLFVFEGEGKIKDFTGNYTEYAVSKKKLIAQQKKNEKPKKEITNTSVSTQLRKASYKETKEYQVLENEISMLEEEKIILIEKMNNGAGTSEELQQWAKRYTEIEQLLEVKSDRWLELSELFETN
jgi:ATP-binding cassette subfamily F protein uup